MALSYGRAGRLTARNGGFGGTGQSEGDGADVTFLELCGASGEVVDVILCEIQARSIGVKVIHAPCKFHS
jgi:hypothetical protein